MTETSIFGSKNLFKELFDNISSGIAIYEVYNDGEDFIFKDFNKAGEKINNLKRVDIIGKRLTEIFPGVKDLGLFEVLQRVWKTGNAEVHPTSMYRDERIALWVHNYVFKIPSGNIVAIFDDITEKKKIEEALETSEEDYRVLVENAQSAIFYLGLDYKISSWNKTAEKIYGYKKNEAIGKTIDELIPVEFIYETREEVEKEFFEKGVWRGEVIQYHKNGTPINILSASIIIKDDEGNPKGMVTLNHDITKSKNSEKKLGESEERFRKIFEEGPYGMAIINLENYRILKANKKLCDLFSYTEKELKVLTFKDFTHPDDIKTNLNMVKKLIKGDILSFTMEKRYITKNKEIVWGNLTSSLIKDKEENPLYGIGMVEDISQRKKTEQKLLESEQNLKNLNEELELRVKERTKELEESQRNYHNFLQNFEGIAFHGDLNFNFTFIQGSFEQITGYKPNEILSGTIKWNQIMKPQDREKFINEINQVRELPNTQLQREFQIKCKDNTIKWIKEIVRNISDEEGRPFMVQGAMYDITEQKKFDESLKESEEMFSKSFHSSPILMAITRMEDGIFIDVNNTYTQVLGYDREELIGQSSRKLNLWVKPEQRREFLRKLKEYNKVDPFDVDVRTKSGKILTMLFSGDKINLNGESHLITIASDITERKKAEERLGESEEKYRRAYYQANLYRDVFAHDLNNMLQNINSSAELSSLYLNNPGKLHTVKELNEITREQVNRGQKLINNIRKITEIDESEIQLEKIKVVKPLEKAIEILKTSYPTREIHVQLNENSKKKFGRANSLLLDVFENLLINAVEHNENPKIEISIDMTMENLENKQFIKMEFKDNGTGISDYRKKGIFEKGIRKDKRSKGMGLGLSLVKKIIDSYNGKIWVENKIKGDYSKGSNFIVLIPTV